VKVDVFAAGIMLAGMCARNLNVPDVAPLTTEYDYAMRERMVSDALERVRGVYPWVAALLQACTDKDMDRRCSAADALLILDGKPRTLSMVRAVPYACVEFTTPKTVDA
jgi:hypothetical protein